MGEWTGSQQLVVWASVDILDNVLSGEDSFSPSEKECLEQGFLRLFCAFYIINWQSIIRRYFGTNSANINEMNWFVQCAQVIM